MTSFLSTFHFGLKALKRSFRTPGVEGQPGLPETLHSGQDSGWGWSDPRRVQSPHRAWQLGRTIPGSDSEAAGFSLHGHPKGPASPVPTTSLWLPVASARARFLLLLSPLRWPRWTHRTSITNRKITFSLPTGARVTVSSTTALSCDLSARRWPCDICDSFLCLPERGLADPLQLSLLPWAPRRPAHAPAGGCREVQRLHTLPDAPGPYKNKKRSCPGRPYCVLVTNRTLI